MIEVSPSKLASDRIEPITIKGQGFLGVPTVALGSSRLAVLRREYRVELPPSGLSFTVTPSSDTELRFEPLGIEPGTYNLRVVPPQGEALVLPDALEITDASASQPPEPRLSLETSADGDGDVVTTGTLSLGEGLRLYAVLRDSDGALVELSERVVFSLNRSIALLRAEEATSCEVQALLPGVVTVRAEVSGMSASAELTLIDDAQSELSDLRLALETAPMGRGSELASEVSEVAGTLLNVYAVVRDNGGRFVVDVPVGWAVDGVEQDAASVAASYQLPLTTAGVTTLRAAHAELGAVELAVRVSPGPASRLMIEPESASARAGDPPIVFAVSGVDVFGNETSDLGAITYRVSEGSLGQFDATRATLTPERISWGRVTATSSYGPEVTSGPLEISAGPLARLTVAPEMLQLTADSAPVQFEVTGVDQFDNEADVGEVSWSIASGPIAALSGAGLLTPTTAGSGTLRATSAYGVSALSGEVTIAPGSAVALQVFPDTWRGVLGGATQAFTVLGVDSDGNSTTDLGTLSYGVTGPIGSIGALTGVFTPTVAGVGTVTVSSSYGPSVATGTILVSNPNATLSIQDLRVSGTLYHGATTRVEVDVRSNDVVPVVLTGLGFTFTSAGSSDISAQYTVVADNTNVDQIAPNVTQTLVYYLSVAGNASYEGTVYTTVRGEAFMSAGTVVGVSRSANSNVSYPAFGTALTIDAPAAAAARACLGGRIAYGATASAFFSYFWRFSEGTLAPGSSVNDRYPSVDYSTVGPKANAVTAYYTLLVLTYPTTLVGKPVFVGAASEVLADTYPTGRVVFSGPVSDQNIALSSFPRSDLVTLDPSVPVRQCNNVAIDPAGHTDLTVFSDRRLFDPSVDIDPSKPGVQVKLTAQGGLPNIPMIAPAALREGPTTVYAEYFEPSSGKVTAAGDQSFNLTGDTQAPSVRWTLPANDCAGACLKSTDPIVLQFSEPMWPASLGNVSVDLYSGSSSCIGAFSDWTGSSTRLYEATENALYINTPANSGTYAVRVRVPATVTDAAAARNAIPASSRCVVFAALADPAAAATPELSATPAGTFSPDGDQVSESLTWSINVDAATTLVRLRITRGNKAIFGKLLPVTQAGTYSLSWDGTDATGRIVTNGAYSYAIEALNRAGTVSAPLKGYVEVASAVRFVTLRLRP